MKYFVLSLVFLSAAAAVHAQTNIPHIYMPKQKQLNNGLKMLAPDLQNSTIAPAQNNTPVLALKNDGIKVNSNNLGDMYSMTTDNMPCLKPFAIKDNMPNAIQPQAVVPTILKEKK